MQRDSDSAPLRYFVFILKIILDKINNLYQTRKLFKYNWTKCQRSGIGKCRCLSPFLVQCVCVACPVFVKQVSNVCFGKTGVALFPLDRSKSRPKVQK